MNVRPTQMIDDMVQTLLDNYNIDVMIKSRHESVVIPRAALFNVCRGYYSASTLGRYFGKNHATILHHFKNHEALMMVRQYREIFGVLTAIVMEYNQKPKGQRTETIMELESLRNENMMLREKIKMYEERNEEVCS